MRRKEIKSLAFFRDLGGIKTEDGHVTKDGVLFRSSEIKNITASDLEEMINDYHIDTCIDLRTDDEISLAPDELKDIIDYRHIPLVSNEDNPAVTKDTRIDILKMRMKEEGGMKGHIIRLYRLLVNNPQSIEGYKKIFRLLLEKESGAAIYHCTQGKDRTGLISVLTLLALGVDKETIIKDYLQYNRYHRFKRFWIFVGMNVIFLPIVYARNLNYALVARRVFIEAAFEEMDKNYGGPMNYLKNVIGLSEEDISLLRKKYLLNA